MIFGCCEIVYMIKLIKKIFIVFVIIAGCGCSQHENTFMNNLNKKMSGRESVSVTFSQLLPDDWYKACLYSDPIKMNKMIGWINFYRKNNDPIRVDLSEKRFLINVPKYSKRTVKYCFHRDEDVLLKKVKVSGKNKVLIKKSIK